MKLEKMQTRHEEKEMKKVVRKLENQLARIVELEHERTL